MGSQRYKSQGQCTCDARCTFALRAGVAPVSIAVKHKSVDDEMIKVPNGVVCAAVNGEVFFESGQSIRPGKVKETVKTHQ